jgi:nanoRNase/pAp phosphatase (c-di-AMP/oligoRNAs hydrolase)
MKKLIPLLFVLAASQAVAQTQQAVPEDHRQLVSMPAPAQAAQRADMLDHLAALNEILGYAAEGKWQDAAETAEKRLGESSMGKYRMALRGQGPGRFMPDAMRQLGWGMHSAASQFAKTAKEGDTAKSLAALQQVSQACVACHMSFRTR